MSRALARLRLVVPSATPPREAVELVVRALSDALMTQGITVTHQLVGDERRPPPSDGLRCDLALWLPRGAPKANEVTPCDPRVVAARAHAVLVVDPALCAPRDLARYDAAFVLTAGHVAAVRDLAGRAGRALPVTLLKLAAPAHAKDAKKAERGVNGVVTVVDLRTRAATGADLERTIMQLTLRSTTGALVLATGDDDEQRRRTRALCERHALAAWIASGDDGMAQALGVADVAVGALDWSELIVAAVAGTAVVTIANTDRADALASALRDAGAVVELPGTLQLAATLDRKLSDLGGLAADGLRLKDALLQPARALHDALRDVEPLPSVTDGGGWEAVGPLAAAAPQTVVASVDPRAAGPSTAQRVEDALAALKARLKDEP